MGDIFLMNLHKMDRSMRLVLNKRRLISNYYVSYVIENFSCTDVKMLNLSTEKNRFEYSYGSSTLERKLSSKAYLVDGHAEDIGRHD